MEMFSIWKRCLNNQNRMLERLIDRFNEKIYGGKRRMKKFAVNKIKVDSTIRDLTKRMYEINLFVSIQTKPHKDSDKVWIIVG